MTTIPTFVRRRTRVTEHPVELRFVDMLLIIIATLMFVAIVLSVISAFNGTGRPDIAPQVLTRSAPTAIVGQPYELTLAVRGGDGDYTWQTESGRPPDGLRFGTNGVITGTPTRAESTRLSVRVADGSGRVSDVRDLTVGVRPSGTGEAEKVPLRIVGPLTLLDGAVAGQQYRHKFTVESGQAPYRWRSTELPAGLEFAADGTLAGRPEDAGTSDFTVTMTDSTGESTRQRVRLDVAEAPDSLFWRVLGWLKIAITIFGYFLVTIFVITLIVGAPASAGTQGLLGMLRRRRGR